MELNKEVPKREYCEKLRELGYPQEGLFWHCFYKPEDKWIILDNTYFQLEKWGAGKPQDTGIIGDYCVAPTVAEMLQIMPSYIENFRHKEDTHGAWFSLEKVQTLKKHERYSANYGDEGVSYIQFYGNTPADSIVKLLIYLLENKLISLEK